MKAIIFDFDGVIHDTFDIAYKANSKILGGVTKEEFKDFFDGNLFKNKRFQKHNVDKFQELYTKDMEKEILQPEIKKQIEILSEKYELFIISSNLEVIIKKFLKEDCKFFTDILGYETNASKVEKFRMILKESGLSNINYVFVTDTLGDILEAKEVGVKTIAIDSGYHERARLLKGKPEAIISKFQEIPLAVEKVFNE